MIAFDRFLDRLLQMYPDRWVVKGGFALQLRIGDQARTTKDIDLLLRGEGVDIHEPHQSAGFMDIGDWFSFEVPPSSGEAFGVPDVSRYNIRAILDGRLFESPAWTRTSPSRISRDLCRQWVSLMAMSCIVFISMINKGWGPR